MAVMKITGKVMPKAKATRTRPLSQNTVFWLGQVKDMVIGEEYFTDEGFPSNANDDEKAKAIQVVRAVIGNHVHSDAQDRRKIQVSIGTYDGKEGFVFRVSERKKSAAA